MPTTKKINLTATTLTQYNNTEIQSRTIVFGSASQVLSDYTILLAQGKAIINKLSVNNVLIICTQVYHHQLLIYLIILLILRSQYLMKFTIHSSWDTSQDITYQILESCSVYYYMC